MLESCVHDTVIGSIGGQELVEAPDYKVGLPGLERLVGTY